VQNPVITTALLIAHNIILGFLLLVNNYQAHKTTQTQKPNTTMPQSQPQSKEQKIAQVQANLPLPEQPPKPPDWQSADMRTTGVGSGRFSGGVGTDSGAEAGLRGPAVKASEEVDMGKIGREGK
jgi:hypothetical protein